MLALELAGRADPEPLGDGFGGFVFIGH
jgi:hypothetical protein